MIAELGFHNVGKLAHIEVEGHSVELFDHLATTELSEIATVTAAWAFGERFRFGGKVGTALEFS